MGHFLHDYSKVGGSLTAFNVRPIQNDVAIIREVASYAKMDVVGKAVLDIGAHIGAYTILAGQLGATHVTAVEPHAGNFKLLMANTRLHYGPEYDCLFGAVGVDPLAKRLKLYVKSCPSMNSAYVKGGEEVSVRAYFWPELMRRQEYGAIKLDCEGAEYDVLLRGGSIPESVTSLLVELHLGKKVWRNEHAPQVIDLLSNWRCIVEPKIGPKNWVTLGIWER